ncbi:DUF2878 domain-containing protein [Lysobacter koreensis]|uniref:DUF2878 domain-containing protein n=1 Tax=Lysobacter koreensis TaxID=266122 RepID=A0ABW2YI33_9GAMM
MRFWANAIGYQVVWFVAVVSAARGEPWTAAAVALVFVAAQWLASSQRDSDARLVVCALAIGMLFDGLLAASGWLRYASPAPALFAPAWILAVWAAFAMTLNHSLAFLRGHHRIAAVFGAVGGSLAYLAAARGFDAVSFVEPGWRALALLALGWAVAMPLLAALAQHWRRHATSLADARGVP